MSELSPILFVIRYFRPDLIDSAPFTNDLAEWLAKEDRQIAVLSGVPPYPGSAMFPACQNGCLTHETMGGVTIGRLRSGPPQRASALARILNEVGFMAHRLWALLSGRVRRHPMVPAPLIPGDFSSRLDALVAQR